MVCLVEEPRLLRGMHREKYRAERILMADCIQPQWRRSILDIQVQHRLALSPRDQFIQGWRMRVDYSASRIDRSLTRQDLA
ncbi:hypothetical protein Terro_0388 [Terriglobus roseus DSM 18391]|uniref:Uncharacterized protein n=1 Tax=Terriglobus roseus (strain DSM 18391 / NRRL B-41598 / KBS 63) TaxID=926566 RepID=I3ZBW9_TERRK|nr:hypothetical protein Terro_0388 [Terriglobus roseus DSM 18391]